MPIAILAPPCHVPASPWRRHGVAMALVIGVCSSSTKSVNYTRQYRRAREATTRASAAAAETSYPVAMSSCGDIHVGHLQADQCRSIMPAVSRRDSRHFINTIVIRDKSHVVSTSLLEVVRTGATPLHRMPLNMMSSFE